MGARHVCAQGIKAVEADEPFCGGGTKVGCDIPVPAPQTAFLGHDPLADCKRRAIIAVDHTDLRQAAGEGCWSGHLIGKAYRARGQFGITGLHVCAGPAALAISPQRRVKIVAEGCCQRLFKPRLGFDRIEHTVAAAALRHGLFQRAHFTVEGGQSGLCRSKVRLRGVARHRSHFAGRVGIGHRLLGSLRIGIGFRAGKLGGIQLSAQRGIVAECCHLLLNLHCIALDAFQSLRSRGHGGVCDARFGLFAGLCGQRLGERDFGIASGGFGRGQPFDQLRTAGFR